MISIQDDKPDSGTLLRPWEEIDVVSIVLTLAGAWLTVLLFAKLVRWLSQRLPVRLRFYLLPWPPIVRLLAIIVATVVITPLVLVPKPEAMFALAGSGAVALGFAFKDYVSSLIAGVVVLFERPCSVGDWIRVGSVYGMVTNMRLRVIELVTPDDDRVSIPLSTLWTETLHNSNGGQPDQMCVADFFLDPEHDPRVVHRALEDVALTSAHLNLERPVSVVAQEQLYATHYRLKAYPFDASDQFAFATDLTLRGKQALRALGVLPAIGIARQPEASRP